MPATRVRAWKRRLHRVPRARGRYRTAVAAVADTTHAAMSRTCTGANSCPAASASEQRAGRCDQQCRYGGYCKKFGYPRHDDLLFVINSASKAAERNPPRPCSFVRSKLGHPMMFHAKKKVGTPLLMGWNRAGPRPPPMSATGQKRRFDRRPVTSGLPQLQTYRCTALTDAMCQQETLALHKMTFIRSPRRRAQVALPALQPRTPLRAWG